MNLLFKATKIKLLEMAIDILFNRIRLNFINYNHNVVKPCNVVVGMKLTEIRSTSLLMEGTIWRNCTVLEVEKQPEDIEDINSEPYYEVMFEFEEIAHTPYTLEYDEDKIDTIYIQENSNSFILIK